MELTPIIIIAGLTVAFGGGAIAMFKLLTGQKTGKSEKPEKAD